MSIFGVLFLSHILKCCKNLAFGSYILEFEITSIQYPTYQFQTCVTFLSKIIE